MTNLGLEHALGALKVPFARARVGDRYVLELMQARGWELGGENSGHIICLDRHTTGDGIVSALQVLAALRSRKATLASAASGVTLYPQVLINVPTARGVELAADRAVKRAVSAATAALRGAGRVLLRPSGTEPVLRVMVEGKSLVAVKHWAESIADCVRRVAAHDDRGAVMQDRAQASGSGAKAARTRNSLRISKTSGRIRAREV